MSDCSAHRVPRAGLDPIDGPATALAVIRLAVHVPHVHETVVLLLDHDRCGLGITVVGGTARPDDVLEVAECLATAAAGSDRVGSMVIASVRPGVTGPDEWDPDRWVEMSELAEQVGIELLEWFVIGSEVIGSEGISSEETGSEVIAPRDHLGEPPRW